MYDPHTVSVMLRALRAPVEVQAALLALQRCDGLTKANSLTGLRPLLAESQRRVRSMPEAAATVVPFPSDRAEAPSVRLALASILATGKRTQLEVARCGVNMRRASAGLKALPARKGAPSPVKALEELQRACSACGGCRGI